MSQNVAMERNKSIEMNSKKLPCDNDQSRKQRETKIYMHVYDLRKYVRKYKC